LKLTDSKTEACAGCGLFIISRAADVVQLLLLLLPLRDGRTDRQTDISFMLATMDAASVVSIVTCLLLIASIIIGSMTVQVILRDFQSITRSVTLFIEITHHTMIITEKTVERLPEKLNAH